MSKPLPHSWTSTLGSISTSLSPSRYTFTDIEITQVQDYITHLESMVGTVKPQLLGMSGRRSSLTKECDIIQLCLNLMPNAVNCGLTVEKQIILYLMENGYTGRAQLSQDAIVVIDNTSGQVTISYFEEREITLEDLKLNSEDKLITFRLHTLNRLWPNNTRQCYDHAEAVANFKSVNHILYPLLEEK